jgi:hypothetical protein
VRHFWATAAGRSLCLACAVPVVSLPVVALARAADASPTPPALVVSPKGNVVDAQPISVSVGANGYFTPHAGVNILECSDPGGLAANLPKDDKSCDGNTIQGSTILVGANGSFSDSQFPVYALPSSTLGEQSNFVPVCNQTNYCVLYVGQNQNDFTAPRVFSAPFLVTPGSGTASTSTTAAGAVPGTTSSGSSAGLAPASPASAATGTSGSNAPTTSATTASGALANTGLPPQAAWLVVSGAALLVTGALGRRMMMRART